MVDERSPRAQGLRSLANVCTVVAVIAAVVGVGSVVSTLANEDDLNAVPLLGLGLFLVLFSLGAFFRGRSELY